MLAAALLISLYLSPWQDRDGRASGNGQIRKKYHTSQTLRSRHVRLCNRVVVFLGTCSLAGITDAEKVLMTTRFRHMLNAPNPLRVV